jgi:outer membrane protein TolC
VQLVPGELFGQPGTSIPVSFYTKHNLQGGVRATQILFDMTAFVGVRLAKEASEWSAIKLDAARADTAHDIASLYLLIVAANAQAKVFQEDIERIERLHRIVQAQYAAGLVLGTDVARVAVERDNLVTEKANLDLLIARQHDMLAHTMGRFGSFATAGAPPMVLCDPLDRSLLSQPAADVRLPTIAEYATGPLHERAELRLREQQLEMADASEHLARAAFFPSLSAYSEWSYMGQRDRFDFFEHDGQKKWFEVQVVGLALSVPIFDGWQQMARVHQAEVDRRITATSSDFTRDSMTIEYAHAVEALRTSADAEARQAESVSAAAKTYDLTLKQYQQGVASLSDLLSVETSMSRARLGYLNSVHQLRIAELDILRATGKLLTLADREE